VIATVLPLLAASVDTPAAATPDTDPALAAHVALIEQQFTDTTCAFSSFNFGSLTSTSAYVLNTAGDLNLLRRACG